MIEKGLCTTTQERQTRSRAIDLCGIDRDHTIRGATTRITNGIDTKRCVTIQGPAVQSARICCVATTFCRSWGRVSHIMQDHER